MTREGSPRWIGLLVALAALAALFAAGARATEDEAAREVLVRVMHDGAEEEVFVLLPSSRPAREGSVSVIVALHGRGEALRGPARGARGWLDDYALRAAFVAMRRGRLDASDFGAMASERQIGAANRLLRRHPFDHVAVVMPYTPDLIEEAPGSEALVRYGRWLAEELLPALRRALPELTADASRTGIDGVSLGGMVALDVGLRHPESFGSVGGIQPAVRGRTEAYAALATDRTRCLRLASSSRDPFLRATRALSRAWLERGRRHTLVEYEGPHGYAFNRGPGSVEFLRFHHECFSRSGR